MSKTFGNFAFVDSDAEPVYILQRQPFIDKKQTRYEIWVEDDGIAISTSQLSQLLADTLQSVIKPAKPKTKDKER